MKQTVALIPRKVSAKVKYRLFHRYSNCAYHLEGSRTVTLAALSSIDWLPTLAPAALRSFNANRNPNAGSKLPCDIPKVNSVSYAQNSHSVQVVEV